MTTGQKPHKSEIRQKTNVAVAASAFIFASAMVLAPFGASAMSGSDPVTVTEGTGFPTADTLNWQAEGRIGNAASSNPLSGDWELGVGTNTQNPETSSMEQFAWKSNQAEPFTVTYEGGSTATFTVGGTSTEFDVGEVSDTADLYVFGKRSPGFTVVNNLKLDGQQIDGSISPGFNDTDGDNLKISGSNLSDGFTLTGDVRLTFLNGQSFSPSGSALAFQVQVRGDEVVDEAPEKQDNTGPVIENFSIANASTLSGNVDVSANVADENSVENVKLEILKLQGFASVPTGVEVDLTREGNDSMFRGALDTTQLESGDYTARVTATDASANMNTSEVISTIKIDNQAQEEDPMAPVIEDTFDVEAVVGQKLQLKPEVTSEIGGKLDYEWQVSDDSLLRNNTKLDKKALKLQPSVAGEYTATLMATDKAGNESEATYNVTVAANNDDNSDNGNNNGGNSGNNGNNGGNQDRGWFADLSGSANTFFINVYNFFGFRF